MKKAISNIIILSCVLLADCMGSASDKKAASKIDSNNDKIKFSNAESSQIKNVKDNGDTCINSLRLLIKSSNVSNNLKYFLDKCKIEPDGLTDSILFIRLYLLNEESSEVGLGYLEIDAKRRRLIDVTETDPKLLKCDSNLLNFEIENCINWKDNK